MRQYQYRTNDSEASSCVLVAEGTVSKRHFYLKGASLYAKRIAPASDRVGSQCSAQWVTSVL